jgi:hypothetical protein
MIKNLLTLIIVGQVEAFRRSDETVFNLQCGCNLRARLYAG